tara:strand:- start:890 stop:1396 length:507 start_codon:yes stop_codon:yes gene_type:complete
MVIEDESILTTEEEEYIKNTILSDSTPFWWIKESILGEGKPLFIHILIHRETQQIVSEHANFFQKIAKRFATRHKIPCNVFLRGAINLTYPQSGKSAVHIDHNFPHYQFLLHLNKADGGSTLILDSKGQVIKTISPKQFKGFGFKGGLPHCMTFPNTGRRVLAVLTFL